MARDTQAEVSWPGKVGVTFITYSSTQDGRVHDARTRQLVRKQAINASRKAQSTQHPPSHGSPPENRSLKASQGRFRLRKTSEIRQKSIQDNRIAKSISPVAPTISLLGDDASTLLSYYINVFQLTCVAINFESDWLDFVLSNQAASHALLSLVSLSFDADVQSSYCCFRSNKHSAAAVELVRRQLSNGSSVPDDAIICAVALLTVAESIKDHDLDSTAHYHGLNQMLRLRGGGYDAFSHCKALQKVISWARRIYCLRTHSPLDLPPVPASSRASFDEFEEEPQCLGNVKASILKRNNYASVISRELEELQENMQTLSLLPAGPSRTLAQRQQISYIVYDAEYKLILLNQGHLADLAGLSSAETNLSTSYQLAAQVYTMVALRHVKLTSPLVQRYVQALRSDAWYRMFLFEDKGLKSNRAWSVLLLWIETVLAIATTDSEKELESLLILGLIIDHFGCTDLDDFIGILKEVCWLDGFLEDQIRHIWAKVKS